MASLRAVSLEFIILFFLIRDCCQLIETNYFLLFLNFSLFCLGVRGLGRFYTAHIGTRAQMDSLSGPILSRFQGPLPKTTQDRRWTKNSQTHKRPAQDCKHSKVLMEGPQQGRATKLLNMSRQQLFAVIGLLTGHLGLNGYLYKIGKDINPLCRRCLSGNETV